MVWSSVVVVGGDANNGIKSTSPAIKTKNASLFTT